MKPYATGRINVYAHAPPALLERFTVALLYPRRPLNVGVAARSMANFGIRRLLLIAPEFGDLAKARESAVGAEDIVDNARIVNDFAAALAPFHMVVGTTSRLVAYMTLPQAPRQAAPDLAARAAAGAEIALLFGPEFRGLSNAEIERCGTVLSIPVSARHPSLNLAQAVTVVAYEIFCQVESVALQHGDAQAPQATGAEFEAFAAELEGVVHRSQALRGKRSPLQWRQAQGVLRRANMTTFELFLWRKIFRQLEYLRVRLEEVRPDWAVRRQKKPE